MIDAHNHLQELAHGERIEALGRMRAAGVCGAVVNAVDEADWPQILELERTSGGFTRAALGIHPWRAGAASEGWEARLRRALQENPGASVGECGLDGWTKDCRMEQQLPVFLAQLRTAREWKRACTVHCVKAWQQVFQAFELEPPPAGGFLVHSFGGSPELADRLIRLGASVSFSGQFLHPHKAQVLEMYRKLPADRILLETDAPHMRPPDEFVANANRNESFNHPENLAGIARGLAAARGVSVQKLVADCDANAVRLFGFSAE